MYDRTKFKNVHVNFEDVKICSCVNDASFVQY